MNPLVRLIKAARARCQKSAVVVGVPPSSLTERSRLAAYGPTPEMNELTRDDQRNLWSWMKNMSQSRQRAVLNNIAARQAVQRRTP